MTQSVETRLAADAEFDDLRAELDALHARLDAAERRIAAALAPEPVDYEARYWQVLNDAAEAYRRLAVVRDGGQ